MDDESGHEVAQSIPEGSSGSPQSASWPPGLPPPSERAGPAETPAEVEVRVTEAWLSATRSFACLTDHVGPVGGSLGRHWR